MTKSPQRDWVGHAKSPLLKSDAMQLHYVSDRVPRMQADPPGKFAVAEPLVTTAHAGKTNEKVAPASCKQIIWFGFFFDRIGDNTAADAGTLKYRNVAELDRMYNLDGPAKRVSRRHGVVLPDRATEPARIFGQATRRSPSAFETIK